MRLLFVWLLTKRWTWFVLGIFVALLGAGLFLDAHVLIPVEIDGTIAHYKVWTRDGIVYDHTELNLANVATSYTFNKDDFTPTLPDDVYADGKINIWVDRGNTGVLAMTLYDAHDQNPIKYTTDLYLHPDHAVFNGHLTGGITAGAGLAMFLVGCVWPLFPFARKRRATRSAVRLSSAANGRQQAGPSFAQTHDNRGYQQQRRSTQPVGYSDNQDAWGSNAPRSGYGWQGGYDEQRRFRPLDDPQAQRGYGDQGGRDRQRTYERGRRSDRPDNNGDPRTYDRGRGGDQQRDDGRRTGYRQPYGYGEYDEYSQNDSFDGRRRPPDRRSHPRPGPYPDPRDWPRQR